MKVSGFYHLKKKKKEKKREARKEEDERDPNAITTLFLQE